MARTYGRRRGAGPERHGQRGRAADSPFRHGKAARRDAARKQARRGIAQHLDDAYQRVRRHRRRPPDDGPIKSVKVREYLREAPGFQLQELTIAGERFIGVLTKLGRGIGLHPAATYFDTHDWRGRRKPKGSR